MLEIITPLALILPEAVTWPSVFIGPTTPIPEGTFTVTISSPLVLEIPGVKSADDATILFPVIVPPPVIFWLPIAIGPDIVPPPFGSAALAVVSAVTPVAISVLIELANLAAVTLSSNIMDVITLPVPIVRAVAPVTSPVCVALAVELFASVAPV